MLILRILAIVLVVAPASGLCDIPVFRYALERWPAAPYSAIVFHRGPLSAEEEAVLDGIRGSAANVVVEKAEPGEKLDEALQQVWKSRKGQDLPWMEVRFPGSEPAMASAWSGRPERAAVGALLDSPARREIVRRLLLGESAVWLLLESGDAARDDAAAKLLGTELSSLEKTLKLPVADEDEIPLLSEIPLRIAFSVLRLSRRDPAEKEFVAMLSRSGGALAEGKGPAALPVFGRGRALWPLAGETLAAPGIAEAAEFLTGACSCQVKEMNPGLDLLFDADWEKLLSAPPGTREPASVAAAAKFPPATPPAAAEPVSRPSASWKALWAVVAITALAVLLTGALILRPRRPSAPC